MQCELQFIHMYTLLFLSLVEFFIELVIFITGISLVDETPSEDLEEEAGVELTEGVKVAYTLPQHKVDDSADTVSDTQASLDDLMAQMKAMQWYVSLTSFYMYWI